MGAACVPQWGELWLCSGPCPGSGPYPAKGFIDVSLSSAGFVVGHAGLYQALAMFAVAYFIIGMTVLSVCAIATNGALDAGGAYCILCCGCCWGRPCAPKLCDHSAALGCHTGTGTSLSWEGEVGAPTGGLSC